MNVRRILCAVAVLALVACEGDGVEKQLSALQPAAKFTPVELLPEGLRAKEWILRPMKQTSSDLPLSEGGPLCNAYVTVLDSKDDPLPQNFVAVFCNKKPVPFPGGGKAFVSPVEQGKTARSRVDVQFVDALEKGSVIVWFTDRVIDERGFLTIRERAWRERGGTMESILDAVTIDPTAAMSSMPDGRSQRLEAQGTYAAGFLGEFPKALTVRGSSGRRPFVRRYEYTEGSGYRAPPLIPLGRPAEQDGGVSGLPEGETSVVDGGTIR